MFIAVNGERRDTPNEYTISNLLATLDLAPETTVVERNGAIVDRDLYPETLLAEGDTLELVRIVGGG